MFKKYCLIFFLFFNWLSFLPAQDNGEILEPEEIRKLPDNYKQDYTSKDYDYTESISWLSRVKAWFIDWLKSLFSVNTEKAVDLFSWLQILFYIVVISLAVYVIARLFLRKEGRWIFSKNPEEINSDIAIHENIQSVDFNQLIASAEAQKNYREAIKYRYFYVLKKLDDAGFISFDPQKTTYDYQLELEESKFHKPFNKAAYYYTYIWYGEFAVDDSEYETSATVFSQIIKSI